MEATAEVIEISDQLVIKEFNIQEITAANVAMMEKQILEIPENPETKEQYDSAYRFNVDAKKLLPRIEERRKALKGPVLEKGKKIDETAKTLAEMIQPIIALSGTRRESWEKAREAEKAEKERIESERLAAIQARFNILNTMAGKCQIYNRTAADLTKDLASLEAYEISTVDFQERAEEAEQIKAMALAATQAALENRKQFEEEQARQAEERKRLEEESARLEAAKKAQEEAARKADEEAAERRRKEDERIRLERDAMEKEKARIAHAAIVAEREAVWEIDHEENYDRDRDAAIAIHQRIKACELSRYLATEKAKADAAERAGLIAPDKEKIQEQINLIDAAISGVPGVGFNTDEAAQIITDLYVKIKQALADAEKAGSDLA